MSDICWTGCGALGFHICPNMTQAVSGIGPRLARLAMLERENAEQKKEIARLTAELQQIHARLAAVAPELPAPFMG